MSISCHFTVHRSLEKADKLPGHHVQIADHLEQRHIIAASVERQQVGLKLPDLGVRWLWQLRSPAVRHSQNGLQLTPQVTRLLAKTDGRFCKMKFDYLYAV